MRSAFDWEMVIAMSLLSQLVPRDPDWLAAIGIAASTGARPPEISLVDAGRAPPGDVRSAEVARDLTRTILCDAGSDDIALGRLEAGLDEYVDVWTPALHTTSRFEFLSMLAGLDDSIADVALTFAESAATRSTAMLAWQATGRFVRPAFLDDDHMLEPNGAVVRLAGATSISFTQSRRADRIRCYYDRLVLVEQMLAPRRVANGA